MMTEILSDDIPRAAQIIRSGGLLAVPTETVYGLDCNALDERAVRRIYEVKGRPPVKPLSLMIPGAAHMDRYCASVPFAARRLAERFWPGPLTIVLQADTSVVPDIIRAGGKTVGLRCPDHPLTLRLLEECGLPLAGPSANPSGSPSPRSAGEVLAYFDGKIDAVLDGGECRVGLESSIVDLSGGECRVLRASALEPEAIYRCLASDVLTIGITGGTGTGKTTALEVLEEMGALLLDCDVIYHRLTVENQDMQKELTERFGSVYVDGVLDRKKLGKAVFSDKQALLDLNAITHRYVALEVWRLLADWAVKGGTLAAIDAIALLESPVREPCTYTVAITASEESRLRRIMAREGISEEYARLRISAQKDNDYFINNCMENLSNDGTQEEFKEKCRALFTRLTGGR